MNKLLIFVFLVFLLPLTSLAQEDLALMAKKQEIIEQLIKLLTLQIEMLQKQVWDLQNKAISGPILLSPPSIPQPTKNFKEAPRCPKRAGCVYE